MAMFKVVVSARTVDEYAALEKAMQEVQYFVKHRLSSTWELRLARAALRQLRQL